MKGLKRRRRLTVLLLIVLVLLLGVGLIGLGLGKGVNYFRAPSEVMEEPPREGEVFRLGGLVEAGSLVRGQGETVTFSVTDGGATVPVRYTGVLPDLFAEGQGMIGTGVLEEGTFVAREILAKHDESYMPKEVADALKAQGVYKGQATGN